MFHNVVKVFVNVLVRDANQLPPALAQICISPAIMRDHCISAVTRTVNFDNELRETQAKSAT